MAEWRWDSVNGGYIRIDGDGSDLPTDPVPPTEDGGLYGWQNPEVDDPEPDPVFIPGNMDPENLALLQENYQDDLDVFGSVGGVVQSELLKWGALNGYSPDQMNNFFNNFWDDATVMVNGTIAGGARTDKAAAAGVYGEATPGEPIYGSTAWLATPEGFDHQVEVAWGVFQKQWSALGEYADIKDLKLPGTGRGSGRKTAQQIRDSFDVSALAEGINNVWRVMLLDEHANPRQLASAYIEAIVATRGEKAIDFEQFVRDKARATARHKSIYRNKPDSLNEDQYLQRYFQTAQQTLRPGNAEKAAIRGAQLGADAGAFSGSLQRSNENVTSAGFIRNFQDRLSQLNSVFKG
jgi:hypothetical protein